MSQLRHDLLTSGWSMMANQKWMDDLNACWHLCQNKWHPDESKPKPIQGFMEEMAWLLHEALPEEYFYLETVETRLAGDRFAYWHTDGGYLRVLFTCQGHGTIVGRSFEDDVPTPVGYSLIMTGQQRTWKTGIRETWHTAPPLNRVRRLLLLNFRNGE